MRDQLGNKITEGNLVHWRFPKEIAEGGLIFRVVRASEPKLAVIGEPPTPSITLLVDIPLTVERGREVMLDGFLRVVDPTQEAALEKLAAAGDGTIGRPQ